MIEKCSKNGDSKAVSARGIRNDDRADHGSSGRNYHTLSGVYEDVSMNYEKKIIDRQLNAVNKQIQRYSGNEEMVTVLEHLKTLYNLTYKLYKVNRRKL